MLPAIERRNGLLWYPSLYEGFEYSPNVIYTGARRIRTAFRSPNTSSGTMARASISSAPTTSIRANPTASCAIWSSPTRGKWSARNMSRWLRRTTPERDVARALIRVRCRTSCSRPSSDARRSDSIGLSRRRASIPHAADRQPDHGRRRDPRDRGGVCEGHITAATLFRLARSATATAASRKPSPSRSAPTSRSACGAPAPMPR